jgi:hypothetical protein
MGQKVFGNKVKPLINPAVATIIRLDKYVTGPINNSMELNPS